MRRQKKYVASTNRKLKLGNERQEGILWNAFLVVHALNKKKDVYEFIQR